MSFIEEERKSVIEENNTAQSDFLDFLDHLNPQISDIIIQESLSGDLNFEVLKECNFTNITSLQFSRGNITSLKNIPEGITKLVCEDNLLVEIENLPVSIVELNVSGNGIKRIELDHLSNLKELNISKNQFSSLNRLPKDLETLKCENNGLKLLDLEGIENLKVLHCSNNPLLIIEHFPESVTDLQMENNPLTEINRLQSKDQDNEGEENSGEQHRDYMESLHTYFELKKDYNKMVYTMKKEVFNKAKSKKVAKKLMAQLKPKCINCNRPVGSLFTSKDRTYFAKCGDSIQPCNFDIQIYAGEYGNIDFLLEDLQREVKNIKENIIKQKLDTLFNYITENESIIIFKKQLEEFTQANMFLKELVDEYHNIFFNEERKEKIQKKMESISRIQERFDDLIIKYKQSDNRELLKDAMTIYISELKPEIDNLQLIKYDTIELNSGDNESEFELFQKEYRLEKLDFTFGSYPKVIKFRTTKQK